MVDMLHKEVQRSMENQWQMARLETKRLVGQWVALYVARGFECVGGLVLAGGGRLERDEGSAVM